jgi:hypothetical protein
MLTYKLINTLLDDDDGISGEAYDALLNWLCCHKDGSPELAGLITDAAKAIDGRWFIPEGTNLRLPDPGRMGLK